MLFKKLEFFKEMNIEEEKTDQKAQKNNMTASTFFSKIDKLSSQGLAKILEKRIPQYWALANYLNEQIAPSVSGQVNIEFYQK